MTDQALDELARRVLLDTARQEYGNLIKQPPEHDFTPAFEKKMKKLLRRAKYPAWHQFVQGAACLLLVLLLTGCAVLAVSPAAREVFAGWVREVYETYFVYRYTGQEEADTDNVTYHPTWIPDGWRKSDVSENKATIYIDYENDTGAFMVFIGAKEPEASNIYIENNDCVDAREIQLQVGKANLYIDKRENHSNVIVWTDEETGILFLIQGPLTSGELVRMAESVKPVQLETVYRPTWIPGGYVQQEEKPLYGQVNLEYRSENGAFIFIYIPDPDEGQPVYIDPAGAEQFQAQVNGRPAEVYIYGGKDAMNIILWSDESGTIFLITGTLTKDELIRVAESVMAVPSEPRPTWVPEGYERFDEVSGTRGSIVYHNQENEQIHLRKHPYSAGAFPEIWISMTEGDVGKQVLVKGQPADLYLAPEGGISFLIWVDEDFKSAFMLNGPLTEEEIIQMAESLQTAPVRQAPHRPSWLPEGYSFAGQSNGGGSLDLQYNAESKKPILFRYWLEGRGSATEAEMQEILADLTPQSVQVDGLPAQLYADSDGSYHLVWNSEEPEGTYWITATLTCEELIRVAESVGVDAVGLPTS